MAFYIVTSNRTDFDAIRRDAELGFRPRHATAQLAALLPATIVQPIKGSGTMLDRLCARIAGTPATWALARALRSTLTRGDILFCTDEAIGIPIAALCGGRAKVMMFVHNIARPRARLAFRLFSLARRTAAFMAVAKAQTDFLENRFGIGGDRLLTLSDQTDLRFFSPGDGAPRTRPTIVSVGLEKRDYRTLAAATAGLDVDVRISGFSTDAKALAATFPAEIPANMSKDFYSWPDLLTLYRTADVVVVSLFPNSYAAGIQAMLEAIACGRPVIVTRTEGLADYLTRPDLVTTVETGDARAMQAAIEAKLNDPAAAARQAQAALAQYRTQIDSDLYVLAIADTLRSIAARP